jgi:hypothetical protein
VSSISEIHRSLGRIEGALEEIKRKLDDGDETMERHDKRLRKVEGRQHWYAGGVATIAFFVNLVASHR